MNPSRGIILLATLVLIIAGGTAFFRHVEGWSWLDSYFFTVVTLSTVGYGSLVPITALGKIGTTVMIFLGLGVFALVIQQFAAYAIARRLHRQHGARDNEPKIHRSGQDHGKDTPPS